MKPKAKSKPMIKPSHRGLLHKDLGVPQGQKIGKARLEKAKQSSNPAIRKRANFALNFNHNGHHGVVTSINMHHNGEHASVEVAHGRRQSKKNADIGYDSRPTSRIMMPKAQAGNLKIGQRVGVGAMPLAQRDEDMDDKGEAGEMKAPSKGAPSKKSALAKKRAKSKKRSTPKGARIAAAMGASY